jgi:hypothetical protein
VRLLCWLAKSIGLQAAGLLTLLFFQLLNWQHELSLSSCQNLKNPLVCVFVCLYVRTYRSYDAEITWNITTVFHSGGCSSASFRIHEQLFVFVKTEASWQTPSRMKSFWNRFVCSSVCVCSWKTFVWRRNYMKRYYSRTSL